MGRFALTRLGPVIVAMCVWLTSPVLHARPSPEGGATTADLIALVFDQSRGMLAGATVTVVNRDNGQIRTAVTEADGRVAPA